MYLYSHLTHLRKGYGYEKHQLIYLKIDLKFDISVTKGTKTSLKKTFLLLFKS